jgi:hypothetical protein
MAFSLMARSGVELGVSNPERPRARNRISAASCETRFALLRMRINVLRVSP